MKEFFFVIICVLFLNINCQAEKKYTYYLYLNDYNQAPTFNFNSGLLVYSGTNQVLKAIFDKYKIYQFNQAFPDFIDSQVILNVFLVEANSIDLANDLIHDFPTTFLSYDDLTDKFVEPLAYYPNDYGTTHVPNFGANVSRKELDYLDAPNAWEITKGSSATLIGISDTGFDNNAPDLIDKLSFVSGWNGFISSWSHGTSVAAMAAARGDNFSGTVGVCMNCNVLASPIGFGNLSSVTAFNNLRKLAEEGARVINMSWHNGTGHQNFRVGYRQVEQDIINFLVETYDVVFVGAAGNLPSYSTPQSYISQETNGIPNGNPISPFGELFIYPASYDNVISVSTVCHQNPLNLPLQNTDSTYCCTSPWFPIHGDLEDSLSHSVSSLDPNNPVAINRNGYYINQYNPDGFQWSHTLNGLVDIVSTGYDIFDYSSFLNPSSGVALINTGTSYSAPIVSGTIGLMFDLNSCLTSEEVRSILQLTSKDIEHYSTLNQNFIDKAGSGKLEIAKSVVFVDEMTKPNGNAIISNHTFTRFNFNLKHINNILTIDNVVFKENNVAAFTVKKEIEILNSDFSPNNSGDIDLKIDSNILICSPNQKNSNITNAYKEENMIKRENFILFPNPNKGSFSILLNRKNVKDVEVTVLDVFGKPIYQTKANQNEFELNIPNLPTGLYIVKLSSNEINETLKFVKE